MLKEQLAKLAAFAVAVTLVILGLTVNFDRIKGWVSGTQIIVNSSTRGNVNEYLAGEVLRLSLEGVKSPRVIWIFDEGQPVVGNIEAAFPFESQLPSGQARDRRVDAFFKSGDAYEATSTLVRTRNVNYTASVDVSDSELIVRPSGSFATEWLLTGASLARFSAGRFATYPLAPKPDGTMFVGSPGQTGTVFGYGTNTDVASALKTDESAWTQYDFKNKTTGALLTIAKPVVQE
jgi:hypothetical protein